MSVFADASALVKLYADEADHELIRSLSVLVVSQAARVEVPAALWRKHRMGELSALDTGLLVADFEADYFGTEQEPPRFAVVSLRGSPACTAFAPLMRFSWRAPARRLPSSGTAERWSRSTAPCVPPPRPRASPCCQPCADRVS